MSGDAQLVAALRRGDEPAVGDLVDRWGPALLRLARAHVPSHAVAGEVVQETWVAVLRGMGEEGEALVTAAYGENHARLADLKRRHDPGNLFAGNMNITPAP
ncbi:MAG TPA: BBE domain-containing protein [Miltoncostaeaceae bacterium]|nr:BBE domain-containing protein [Miltoncostaeaceae bacterium]